MGSSIPRGGVSTLRQNILQNAVDPQWTAPFAELNAEVSIWEDQPSAAARAVEDGLATFSRLSVIVAGQIGHIGPLYALGLRAEADLAGLARGRRRERLVLEHVERGQGFLERMRAMHQEIRQRLPSMVAIADGYLALCEAEASRLRGELDPAIWAEAAEHWRHQGMRPALG